MMVLNQGLNPTVNGSERPRYFAPWTVTLSMADAAWTFGSVVSPAPAGPYRVIAVQKGEPQTTRVRLGHLVSK